MKLTEKEAKLIIVACEMAREQLRLKWDDWFFKYTQLTKEGRELYKKSSGEYNKLVNKFRGQFSISKQIYLDKVIK